jgi:hypothetical protein
VPLLRFDIIEGRSEEQLDRLLDITHRIVVETFGVPERDRYQLVTEHKPSHVRALDTGLGLTRTNQLVILQITSRPREVSDKLRFYRDLSEALEQECGLAKDDLMISFVTNNDEDWSFGRGRAQFITGDLYSSHSAIPFTPT